MKVVILAGGLGTRLSEETNLIPKPLVEIGGHPILWHIMKTYSHWGFNDFVILTGYKSHLIKDYFLNYYIRYSDISVDMRNNQVKIHEQRCEPWKVTMLYTGEDTLTGGRLLRAKEVLKDETFMLTYGDGVSDVNISELIKTHQKSNKTVTLTAAQPSGRFGALSIDKNGIINSFQEKPDGDGAWINGGFFVMEPKIFDYLKNGDETILERDPLENLAKDGLLSAYKHNGFWKPMDTLKDKNDLITLWQTGNAPWALWLQDEKDKTCS